MKITFESGDKVVYRPSKPYAPWVLVMHIDAEGTIVEVNDEFTYRVRFSYGAVITAALENLRPVPAGFAF